VHFSSLWCVPFASVISFISSSLYFIFSEDYKLWNFSCSFL
jgi:hypothetical protein